MIKAILTKPLDGDPEGTEREFDKVDFERLEGMGAVRRAAEPSGDPDASLEEKAAPAPLNKMEPTVENKAAPDLDIKTERASRRRTEG